MSILRALAVGTALAGGGVVGKSFYVVQSAQSAAEAARKIAETQRKELLSFETKLVNYDIEVETAREAILNSEASLSASERAVTSALLAKAAHAAALRDAEDSLQAAQLAKSALLISREKLEQDVIKADEAALEASTVAVETAKANDPKLLLDFAKNFMSSYK